MSTITQIAATDGSNADHPIGWTSGICLCWIRCRDQEEEASDPWDGLAMIGTDFQRSVWKTMDLPVCSTTLKRCGDATRRKISESPTQSLFADYPLMRDHRNLRLRNVDVIEAGAFGVRLLGAVGFDLAPWIEKETGILLEKFGGIDKVIECTVPAKN